MKEILVISGKGGTGKTTITAAIASMLENAVFADCDVDAADLHLLLNPTINSQHDFISGHLAKVREDECLGCGLCEQTCRFEAIKEKDGKYYVDPISCEGCGVCVWSCPAGVIDFEDNLCGHWNVSDTRFGKMVHAKLYAGAENSGKLVSVVRNESKKIAMENNNDYILIDGPPGIGCPVTASMAGVNSVIVVTEPTLSGMHDMKRVLELGKHFSIDTYVCINKYNINEDMAKQIKVMLKERNIPLIGLIPYDRTITTAQIKKQTIIEYSDSDAAKAIKDMWNTFLQSSEK